MNKCEFPGCTRQARAKKRKGMCRKHHEQTNRDVPECSFDGCGRPVRARGICTGHYAQWSRGKQLRSLEVYNADKYLGMNFGEIVEQKLAMTIEDEHGCWIYPKRAKSGYATLTLRMFPHMSLLHQYVIRHYHGEPKSAKSVTRHLCGRGAFGCVRPDHLLWGTQKENGADTSRHGTQAKKLTEKKVRKIRQLARDGAKRKDLAAMFGVDKSTIGDVLRGKIWRYVEM